MKEKTKRVAKTEAVRLAHYGGAIGGGEVVMMLAERFHVNLSSRELYYLGILAVWFWHTGAKLMKPVLVDFAYGIQARLRRWVRGSASPHQDSGDVPTIDMRPEDRDGLAEEDR